MQRDIKEVTIEELIRMINMCEGEFIIHVEPGREGIYGKEKSVPA